MLCCGVFWYVQVEEEEEAEVECCVVVHFHMFKWKRERKRKRKKSRKRRYGVYQIYFSTCPWNFSVLRNGCIFISNNAGYLRRAVD